MDEGLGGLIVAWEGRDMGGWVTIVVGALLATAAVHGDFDAAQAGEGTLTALLADKTVPTSCTEWRCAVPLVLIDTDYAPFTPRPRPDGRVIYLRPAQEHDYLASLAEAGLIQYLVADSD